jgi:hydrogenase 3 maturation protease
MPTPELLPALKRALEADGFPPAPAVRPVAVLGVGSELRADDAAGVRVAAALARDALPGVNAIDGGTAPENCTAEVRRIAPSHLIIVDAADLGENPGAVRVIPSADIGGTSFGTHSLPLSVVADYLRTEVGCRVIVIGIQPRSLAFGQEISAEVADAVAEVTRALRTCLGAPLSSSPPPLRPL